MLLLLGKTSDMCANMTGKYGSEVLTNSVSLPNEVFWFTSTRMENQNMYNIFTDILYFG